MGIGETPTPTFLTYRLRATVALKMGPLFTCKKNAIQ